LVHILLANGANVNFKHSVNQMTPLHWAAYNDSTRLVRLLLSKGARQILNRERNSPVDIAGFCGNNETVDAFADTFEEELEKILKVKQSFNVDKMMN